MSENRVTDSAKVSAVTSRIARLRTDLDFCEIMEANGFIDDGLREMKARVEKELRFLDKLRPTK